jgi:hypothetical protein
MLELKLRYFSKLGDSIEALVTTAEYMPSNETAKPQQGKALQEFIRQEKEIFEKVKASIYRYYLETVLSKKIDTVLAL